ncbi:ShK domain-containing protein [Caenorhabditis elegans]|uniref:ShK domain-containing protein n=2 Tax=Caenorhabditis elegans TaxID=6239 RepID=Q0WKU2_CAEEL|nr:ShK domain-containing protein [Caenorhabditis elegans]CAL22706.1 ShK domain-containing protein [Caenorhabditis elegans]|eukprot:NP_001076741.1 Uncharacterized protein CELE_Y67A10A.11 [Caenorhabditis elegans]
MKISLIYLILLPIIAHGATCPVCPVGGLWSDWTTTETCATTCGGCSQINYSRTCLSTQMGNCPCIGVTTKLMICNTQACNWPRVNATYENCCTGTLTTIANWVHCAPLPDNYTLACCPDGGYWTTWSGYSKVSNQAAWQRSRTCLSGSYNCPCTGDSVMITHTCPCTPITVITSTSNTCAGGTLHDNPFSVRTPVFMSSQCETLVVLKASNIRNNFFTLATDGEQAQGSIGYIDTSGTCRQSDITVTDGASAVGSNGQFLKYSLTCNLNTLRFDGTVAGVAMTNVVSFAQYY